MKKSVFLIGAAAALLLSGCMSMGPKSISANRAAYNMAIQSTNDQELLLNLVRLQYRDTLYFTSVERVAATLEFNQGLTASGVKPLLSGSLKGGLTMGGSVGLNEKPTVFYAPIEGEKFVRQMMTPMNPDLLLLLVKSGWSIDRVLRVGVQEMNGLKNAPTAAGPTPSREPEFRDFQEAVRLLRVLQREQLLDLAAGPEGRGVELRFVREANTRPETQRLRELLKLSADSSRFRIVAGVEAPDANSIAITTRPVLSALSYVAQGIRAPADDIKAGFVRQTVRADKTPFDWQELLGELFLVQSSTWAPSDASVAIQYRGHYFYIADNDLETKSTFVLLTQIMALHSAPASAAPALNFSFGR